MAIGLRNVLNRVRHFENSGHIANLRPAAYTVTMKLTCLRPKLLPPKPADRKGWAAPERGDRHQRGYGYEWEKLRLTILQRDCGLCQCPDCLGGRLRLTPANEVHHIVGKAEARQRGWTTAEIDHPSNLQAVNRECHAKLTSKQAHGGG